MRQSVPPIGATRADAAATSGDRLSARVHVPRTSDTPTVEVKLRVCPCEMAALSAWANERVQIEFERAEELRELGLPHAHELWVAGFAFEIACVLEMLKAP